MLARHSLAWPSARGWAHAREACAPDARAALARWQQANWPAVVRRADADAKPHEICLGVALPPDPHDGGKLRIAVRIEADEVAVNADPLQLARIVSAMPAHWQAPVEALADAAGAIGIELRVYGSAALQAITALPYLHAGSDLDLLLAPANEAQLRRGLALLAAHATHLPLDGEVVFPGGAAVAWKECLAMLDAPATARVLVKHMQGVRLERLDALLARFGEAACAA